VHESKQFGHQAPGTQQGGPGLRRFCGADSLQNIVRGLQIIVAIGLMFFAGVAAAATLETLLMPGKLSAAHAEYEEQCSSCHDRANKARMSNLCLACHKDITTDMKGRQGFHGRALPANARCAGCHGEHKGRAADIVGLEPNAFRHQQTDYQLEHAHASVACGSCHKVGKRYRDAPHACVDCHKTDDIHLGKLGTDCAKCHDVKGFKPVHFDHSKTKFALLGAHDKAACVACHRDSTFKGAPTACNACHAPDDVHRGSRGPACQDCHSTVSWKHTRFDHLKETGFGLDGKHGKISCNACHKDADLKAKLPKTCHGCHAAEDSHTGRFGDDCATCHKPDGWKPVKYDHLAKHKYALNGKHEKLACHNCHTASTKTQELPKECFGCHQADDVHAGGMGRDCAACHRETGWRDQVRFDHDFTRFPLVGLHAAVGCEQCHADRRYRGTPAKCIACHKADDNHKGALGDGCATCHNPNGWAHWQFDHSTTGFTREGAHAKLACQQCHVKPTHEVKLSHECVACHATDDVHDGNFGRDCARCHSTRTFKGAAPQRRSGAGK